MKAYLFIFSFLLVVSSTAFTATKEPSYIRAKQAAKACAKLEMCLTSKQLLPVTIFIERELPQFVRGGKYYLSASETGLFFAIEYDPKTKYIFIHLGAHHPFRVGRGANKIVTKSILYDVKKPEIVACCKQQALINRDFVIGTFLQGSQGVLQMRAYTEHVENGVRYKTIFCKLYVPGRLSNVLNRKSFQLTLKEKMHIALSILKGLEALQAKKLIHHDLKSENFLIHVEKKKGKKRKIEVVIADFDLATFEDETKGKVAQYNNYYSAPEAVFYQKFQPADYYHTDLFAAGCILYRLFYEKKPCWQTTSYIKTGQYSSEKCFQKFVETVECATKTTRESLFTKISKGVTLQPKDEFEWIVLSMVHPSAKDRPSAQKLRKQLESVLKRLKDE